MSKIIVSIKTSDSYSRFKFYYKISFFIRKVRKSLNTDITHEIPKKLLRLLFQFVH